MKIKVLLLLPFLALLCACSSDSNEDDSGFIIPFEGISAQDGENIRYAEINNNTRTAHLFFTERTDLSSVVVSFYLRENYSLVQPGMSPYALNLHQPQRIRVRYKGNLYNYTLTAEAAAE